MCKRSESIASIAKALVQFNAEVSKIGKDSTNPHFKNKYASLDNIIDEIRPILTKNGLSVIQMPGGDGERFTMTTMLIHESGEWIESEPIVMKPVKNDPQGIGSCATYARRYSLAAFLSLNTGEDDDGNGASHPTSGPQKTTPPKQQEQSDDLGAIAKESKLNNVLLKWQTLSGEKDKSKARESFANFLQDKHNVSIDKISLDSLTVIEESLAKKLHDKQQQERKGA